MKAFVIYAAFAGNDIEVTARDPGKPYPVFAFDPLLETTLTAAAADLFPCVFVHGLVRQALRHARMSGAREDDTVLSGAALL